MRGFLMVVAGVSALSFQAPAAAYEQLPKSLSSLSVADFAAGTRVIDDPLEPAVIVSTRESHTRGQALKGAHALDVHLLARIDRATGAVSWQVWHDLMYVGGQKQVTAVHYLSSGAVRTATPIAVSHWLDQCPPLDGTGTCNQNTRVGFELPESIVREIAAGHQHGQRKPWLVRFKDAAGDDVTGGLAPAEVAGLLHVVERWKQGARAD